MRRVPGRTWVVAILACAAAVAATAWLWQTQPEGPGTARGAGTPRHATGSRQPAPEPPVTQVRAREAGPPAAAAPASSTVGVAETAPPADHRAIEGEVVGPDGAGVAWAELIAAWQPAAGGERVATTRHRTGEDGRFRLEAPRGGRFRAVDLEARPPSSGTGLAPSRRVVPLPVSTTVRLVLRRAVRLEGQVWDAATGEGVAGAMVWVRRAERGGPRHGVITDATGRFVLDGLEPGRWRVVASTRAARRTGPVEIEAGAGERATLTLRIERGAVARGTVVRSRDGAPVAGATLRPVPAGTDPLDPPRRGDAPEVETDAQGRFLLAGLAPGPATLLVEHERHPPRVVTAHAAAQGAAAPAEIRLDDGARLQVELRGARVPRAPLTVIVEREGGDFSRGTELEPGAASATIEGLPPGRYRLLLLSENLHLVHAAVVTIPAAAETVQHAIPLD